jgi:tryptophanyl-tRNA synthetase
MAAFWCVVLAAVVARVHGNPTLMGWIALMARPASSSTSCSRCSICCPFRRSTAAACWPACCRRLGRSANASSRWVVHRAWALSLVAYGLAGCSIRPIRIVGHVIGALLGRRMSGPDTESARALRHAPDRHAASGQLPRRAANWIELQYQYECYFFIADWHALTTGYEDTSQLEEYVWTMAIDWLAAGLNPGVATLFIQSQGARARRAASAAVDDHAARLARARAVLQGSAGAAQGKGPEHLRISRLSAAAERRHPAVPRRNTCRSARIRSRTWRSRARSRGASITSTAASRSSSRRSRRRSRAGSRNATLYRTLRKEFQEKGDAEALARARALVESTRAHGGGPRPAVRLSRRHRRRILPEPQVLLTATPKVPGLDGRKMSKSYGNTIGLREDPDSVVKKLKTMQTDPARVRRTDPGDPGQVPGVGSAQDLFDEADAQAWVQQGCRSAGIGCLECKAPLIEKVVEEITGMRKRAQEFEENPELVRGIIARGLRAGARGGARYPG